MSVAASLIATTMNASTPLLLAALGILVAERSGVLNLGVEGIMLMAAIAGYMATVETGSFAVGFIAAVAVGILFALFFAIFRLGCSDFRRWLIRLHRHSLSRRRAP